MKTVAVIQSSYIPWKGYFDIIHDADLFIFYDDVQYTKNDWRNRNKIKGPNGTFWLTIPVPKNSVNFRIDEIQLTDSAWQKKHFRSICECYSGAKFFHHYIPLFEEIYTKQTHRSLSEMNQYFIREISRLLGLTAAQFARSSDFDLKGQKTDRLIQLLKQAGAECYISGPSAKGYLEENKFADAGIKIIYKNYDYPSYPQLWGKFAHEVSIIDLLFNTGEKAPDFIWGRNNMTAQRQTLFPREIVNAVSAGL